MLGCITEKKSMLFQANTLNIGVCAGVLSDTLLDSTDYFYFWFDQARISWAPF